MWVHLWTAINGKATVDKCFMWWHVADCTHTYTHTHLHTRSPVTLVFLPTLFLLLSTSGGGAVKPIDGEKRRFASFQSLSLHHWVTSHSTSEELIVSQVAQLIYLNNTPFVPTRISLPFPSSYSFFCSASPVSFASHALSLSHSLYFLFWPYKRTEQALLC